MSWQLIVNGETALMSIYLEKHWKTSRYERKCELSSMKETFSIRVCVIEMQQDGRRLQQKYT